MSTVNDPRKIVLVILGALLILSVSTIIKSTAQLNPVVDMSWVNDAIQTLSTSEDAITNTTLWEDECSSVIVTGSAAKDGRAILMKNRDWADSRPNRPVYIPATSSTYAFVGVYTNAMGINEKGLAVMNTAMPALETEPGYGNLLLNQKILEGYESVEAVAVGLQDSRSDIGPGQRSSLGGIATCVGVVDRFGAGAFFEISNTKAYVQHIVDGYDTRANHPRIFPGLASGPSGRDQYLLDALDAIYAKNGIISWEDVMQGASRYVRNKELGSSCFSIDGEACNPNTVSAMVAVSGDARYDGKLNIMWGAYGYTPLVSVFVPSMAFAGAIPDSTNDLWSYTDDKYESAQVLSETISLDPNRVREVQKYSFFAEEYTINEYEKLISSVPISLTDFQIQTTLTEFIARTDDYAAEVFIEESFNVEVPTSVSFPIPTISTTTSTSTIITTPIASSITTTSITSTFTGEPIASSTENVHLSSLVTGLSIGGIISIIMVLVLFKRNQ